MNVFLKKVNGIFAIILIAPLLGVAQFTTLPDFRQLVIDTAPSVVNITTVYDSNKKSSGDDSIVQGGGSGFIISQDGYILTNHHVIDDSIDTNVMLSNGKLYDTLLIGSDENSDIALLKIEATNLKALPLGDSDKVEVGEWALAIGSPYGLDLTVTAGIISAKGRAIGGVRYIPFIQSDVAINQGNSGGPLFNIKGEVIGINSMILSKTGGSVGLSFSIPMNSAKNIVEQLKADGIVRRGWLGISMNKKFNNSINLARKYGAKNNYGALISKVTKNSPAALAGLEKGDIITHFNGELIKYTSSLLPMVLSFKPEEEITLTILREEEVMGVTVILGKIKRK